MADFKSRGFAPYQILEGPGNFQWWRQVFRVLAKEEGFWDLYTGVEALLDEPDAEAILYSSRDARVADEPVDDIAAKIVILGKMKDEYRGNATRVAGARGLPARSVHPYLQDEILKFRTPKEIVDHLVATNKLSDYNILDTAEAKIEALSVGNKAILPFINELRLLQQDIQEANGFFIDQQLINKVLRCLPANRFAVFISRMRMDRESEDFTPPTLSQFVHRLLRFEASRAISADDRTSEGSRHVDTYPDRCNMDSRKKSA